MIKGHPKLGAHISAAGGIINTIERALAIGAQCMQIFGASPHQWSAKLPDPQASSAFKKALAKSNISAVYLHAAYLINLASQIPDLRAKSIESLVAHLSIADAIGANGLIFHLGSTMDREKGIQRTIEGIHEVLNRVPGKTNLVMENSAGGGMKLGGNIQDLGAIHKGAASPRLKVCIDTAHTFASGIINEYTSATVKKFVDDLDTAVGIKNVVALHINDSKSVTNSHIDRHENLGHGKIGLAGFKALAQEKRLHHTSWMLEVPGFEDKGPDKENLDILKGCFS